MIFRKPPPTADRRRTRQSDAAEVDVQQAPGMPNYSVAQIAPRTTCASAAQAFTERKGPRVVSCFSVDCVSSSRSRATPSFWLRASSNATTPVTCAVASELPEAKS